MIQCAHCQQIMAARRLECGSCGIAVEGDFGAPRLARLSSEDQQLLEAFLLAGGSLKALATNMSVSYPTVRKRIDSLIGRLSALRSSDAAQSHNWLDAVERGSMTAEKAARLMKESSHG